MKAPGRGPKFENLVDGNCLLEDFLAKEDPELRAAVAGAADWTFDDPEPHLKAAVAWFCQKLDYLMAENQFLEDLAVEVEPGLKAGTAEKRKDIPVKTVAFSGQDRNNSENFPEEDCLLENHPLL